MALALDLASFAYPQGRELFQPGRLRVARGESVGLVGGSGSGKSSLLTLLAGLHPQPLGGRFAGSISIEEPEGGAPRLGYLGSDPESFLTGFCTSVLEEIGWTLFGWGLQPQEVEERVRRAVLDLGLDDLLWHDPKHLSGGQQQMVALAAVWATRPAYLLLDEPASKLDPLAGQRLGKTVAGLVAEQQVAVVWATSRLQEVTWCDTIWHLAKSQSPDRWQAEIEALPADSWSGGPTSAVLTKAAAWRQHWGELSAGSWRDSTPAALGKFTARPRPDPSLGLSVEVSRLRYRAPAQEKDLFTDLNWQVSRGDCMALVGVNGAGKTTLGRLLRGLLRPASGELRVAGQLVGARPVSTVASLVAYTFQEPANLFVKSKVEAELLYSGQLLGLELGEARRRADEALLRFALSDYRQAHPRELSAAAAALLGIALSWITRASVQILDEPLARLDAPGRVVLEGVVESWRDEGTTTIIIAHDLDWLSTVCSCFSVLDQGEVIAQDVADRVFSDPRVRELLGAPLPLAPA